MAASIDHQQLCDDWVKLTLLGCEIYGNDPVTVLKAFRATCSWTAPKRSIC